MIRRVLPILLLCGGFPNAANAQPANVDMAGRQAAPADNALFEVLSRVEQLQSEVQQLRGMVEEQAQTISDLERKQRNMYTDLDSRVQSLTPVPGAQPAVPSAQQPATASGISAPPATVQPAPQPASAAPPAEAAPAAEVKPTAPVAVNAGKGNEKERYQLAYDTLRNGHNDQAVKMFESLLADFPAGEFADNSQYWLGEAYKINREFDKARGAFGKVVSQYPNSSKVPDALLKIGYIEFDQQNIAKARDYLTRVTNSYPGTTAAHLAAKKLAQIPQ